MPILPYAPRFFLSPLKILCPSLPPQGIA
jgi:hypothetical protein